MPLFNPQLGTRYVTSETYDKYQREKRLREAKERVQATFRPMVETVESLDGHRNRVNQSGQSLSQAIASSEKKNTSTWKKISRAASLALSGTKTADFLLPGTPGTDLKRQIERIPKVGGFAANVVEDFTSPVALATAGFGGGLAATALRSGGRLGRPLSSLLAPAVEGGLGRRIAGEAALTLGGHAGALGAGTAAKAVGLPQPVQTGAAIAGGLVGGVAATRRIPRVQKTEETGDILDFLTDEAQFKRIERSVVKDTTSTEKDFWNEWKARDISDYRRAILRRHAVNSFEENFEFHADNYIKRKVPEFAARTGDSPENIRDIILEVRAKGYDRFRSDVRRSWEIGEIPEKPGIVDRVRGRLGKGAVEDDQERFRLFGDRERTPIREERALEPEPDSSALQPGASRDFRQRFEIGDDPVKEADTVRVLNEMGDNISTFDEAKIGLRNIEIALEGLSRTRGADSSAVQDFIQLRERALDKVVALRPSSLGEFDADEFRRLQDEYKASFGESDVDDFKVEDLANSIQSMRENFPEHFPSGRGSFSGQEEIFNDPRDALRGLEPVEEATEALTGFDAQGNRVYGDYRETYVNQAAQRIRTGESRPGDVELVEEGLVSARRDVETVKSRLETSGLGEANLESLDRALQEESMLYQTLKRSSRGQFPGKSFAQGADDAPLGRVPDLSKVPDEQLTQLRQRIYRSGVSPSPTMQQWREAITAEIAKRKPANQFRQAARELEERTEGPAREAEAQNLEDATQAYEKLIEGTLDRSARRKASETVARDINKRSKSVIPPSDFAGGPRGASRAELDLFNDNKSVLVARGTDDGLIDIEDFTPELRANQSVLPGFEDAIPATPGRIRRIDEKIGKDLTLRSLQHQNSILKRVWASSDASLIGIQALPLIPIRLLRGDYQQVGRDLKVMFQTFTNPTAMEGYRTNLNIRAAQKGLPDLEFLESRGLHQAGAESKGLDVALESRSDDLLANITNAPFIKQTNRMFAFGGDAIRGGSIYNTLETLRARGGTLRNADGSWNTEVIDQAIKSVNRGSGWAPRAFGGSIGDTVLFAPRFLESQVQMIIKAATDGTLEGSEARAQLLSLFGMAAGITYLANEARGEETSFNPLDSNFLRIRNVKGADISLLGPWDSLLRGSIRAAQGDPLYLVRTKASPALSFAWDMVSGENVLGQPTHSYENVIRSMLPLSVREIGDQPHTATAVGFLGIKASPLTVSEKLDILLESAGIVKEDPDYEILRRQWLFDNPDDIPEGSSSEAQFSKSVREVIRPKQAENERQVLAGEITLVEFKNKRKSILAEQRIRMEPIVKKFRDRDPKTVQEEWIKTYFNIYEQEGVTDTFGDIIPENFDQAQIAWEQQYGNDAKDFMDRYLLSGRNEVEKQYLKDLQTLDSVGYFDMPRYRNMKSGLSDDQISDYRTQVTSYRSARGIREPYADTVRTLLESASEEIIQDVINAGKQAYQNPERQKLQAEYNKELLWFNSSVYYGDYLAGVAKPLASQTTASTVRKSKKIKSERSTRPSRRSL